MNNVNYIGVDIRDSLQSYIDEYLLKNRHVESVFINSCLSGSYKLLNIKRSPALCVFPFNLIGNLGDWKLQVTNCYSNGFDLMISQFATTDKAKKIRLNYYEKCSAGHISLKETEEGDVFQGLDFESISYKKSNVVEYCVNAGFNYIDSYESEIISIHYFSQLTDDE